MERNKPCICGSGKKYKKCCLPMLPSVAPIDLAWNKLRQTEGTVIDQHLLPYVSEKLPEGTMELAAAEFIPEFIQEETHQEIFFTYCFIPWFLFNWIAWDDFDAVAFDINLPIALNYFNNAKTYLSRDEARFIEILSQTPCSFYCILEVEFEKLVVVKDILLGTTHTIKEKQGTHFFKRGDIVFSRVVTLEDQSIFVGLCPFTLSPSCQTSLIKFRQWLIKHNGRRKLSKESLHKKFGLDVLDYFFDLLSERFEPSSPVLLNTDGELITFSKSYFELKLTPEEAFRKLLTLTLEEEPDEFLECAEKDATGLISYLEFPWLVKGNKQHKHWNNTVMGHITLSSGRLILETNSNERTEVGKRLLRDYLGEAIHFQQTLLEAAEQKFKSLADKNNPACSVEDETLEDKLFLEKTAKDYWDNWFDSPIPVLNNKTPREAAKTKLGRERLEALLLYYENTDREISLNVHFLKPDIAFLKKELQL